MKNTTEHTCHGNEHMPPGPCAACEQDKAEYESECAKAKAEAAHERMLEDYYGASTPQTIQEQYDAAVAERRELRKRD